MTKIRFSLPSAVVLLAAFVLWPALKFPFLLYDDSYCVTDNLGVQGGLSWATTKWAFTTGYFGNWHPLTWLSLQLDWMISDGSPAAFHRTNLCLHLATVGVIAEVYRRLSGSIAIATIATVLYALHPMHVESIAWISERKGILSTFFLALTVLGYLRFIDRANWFNAFCVLVPYTMSLMSKQMGVTLPLLLPLIHLIYPRDENRKLAEPAFLRLYSVLFATAIAFSAIAYSTQEKIGALSANSSQSIIVRLGTAVANYGRYIELYFWPREISFDYYFRSNPYSTIEVMTVVAIGMVAIVFAWQWRRKTLMPILVIGWYAIAFLPVIGILQIGLHSMAMRYSDWPLVMVHLGVAWVIVWLCRSLPIGDSALQRFQIATGIVIAVILSYQTRTELMRWSSDESLYTRALELDPENPKAHSLLGTHYLNSGNAVLANQHFQRSDEIDPANGVVLSNLALMRFRTGDLDEAEKYVRRTLAVDPKRSPTRSLEAMILVERERYDEAAAILNRLLESNPHNFEYVINRAAVARRQGNYVDAAEFYNRALQIDSNRPEPWLFLAKSLQGLGRWPEAADAFTETIKVSGGSVFDGVLGLLQLKLLRGDRIELQRYFDRLRRERSTAQPQPELAMLASLTKSEKNLQAAKDYIAASDDGGLGELERDAFNSAFRLEALGDCFDVLGNPDQATACWLSADKTWPPDAREIARQCRQRRQEIRSGK